MFCCCCFIYSDFVRRKIYFEIRFRNMILILFEPNTCAKKNSIYAKTGDYYINLLKDFILRTCVLFSYFPLIECVTLSKHTAFMLINKQPSSMPLALHQIIISDVVVMFSRSWASEDNDIAERCNFLTIWIFHIILLY